MPLNFVLSDEHKLVRNSVKTMLAKHLPRQRERLERSRAEIRFAEELWQEYEGVGLAGCLIPPKR